MSAADAQLVVIWFLNLACCIATVMVLALAADLLLRRRGAALKALVWTMALAAVVLAIPVQLVGTSTTHPSIRFKDVAESETRAIFLRVGTPAFVATPGHISPEKMTGYVPQAEEPRSLSPSATEGATGSRPDEAPPGDDAANGNAGIADSSARDVDSGRLAPQVERESRSAFTASKMSRKPTVWQLAAWAVVFLLLLSALFLIRVLIGTLSLKNLILKWRGRTPPPVLVQILAELKKALRIKRSVRLLISAGNNAPITFGIFRPTIILPGGLTERMGPDSLRQMLTHELAHIRRHDSLVVFLQRVCMALYFWHPLVHAAVRRLRVLIEDACDDYVLRVAKSPEEYASCLTHLAAQASPRIAGISGWIGARRKRLKLEKRIERILDRRRRIGHVTASAAAITVLAAVGASLGASRLPVFGIAAEENATRAFRGSRESQALKPGKNETPSQQARRLLDEGNARAAIRALGRAIAESTDPSTSISLRYELARIHQLLVDGKALEETLKEIWETPPENVDEIAKFADFCIESGQENLAREAVARLQEMVPEKSVYYASKLYGAFPKREELWFPFQPKPLEKTHVKIGTRDAVMYREQVIPALAQVAVVADLDRDGDPEVILSARRGRKPAWMRVFSPNGKLLWEDEKQEAEWEDILVFDLDGDGKLEIIAVGSGITVYDCGGKVLWQRAFSEEQRGRGFKRARIVRSPKGRYRIIWGTDNRMVCFSPGGNVEWQKIGVLGYSFVTIDLNGDGWDEILTMKMAHAELAAFDQDGGEILTTPTDLNTSRPRLAVEDLDGDGKPEIIGWGGGQKLLVCGMDGKAVWKARSRKRPIYAIGDVEGDGKKEIACVTPTDEIRILNHDGSTRFELAVRTGAVQFADIDGDGKDEILAETHGRSGRYIFCIGHDGTLRWRFPLPWGYKLGFYAMPATAPGKKGIVAVASHPLVILSADGEVLSMTPMTLYPGPLAADLDGDGTKEVIANRPLLRAYHLPENIALWGAMTTPNSIVDSGATAIDVDGDGADELVFPCRGYVCVVNGKGELVRATYVGEFGDPVFGRIDVEGDGKDEILLCGNRRFLVLNGEGEVISAASHRGFEVDETYIAEYKVVLAADIDSVPGEEILTCVDPSGVTAYSTQGHVLARFGRPSWLPVHSYEMFFLWTPQIFPPMDVNGDGKKELVARIDRLFVWDLEGKVLRIGLNDYPNRRYVAFVRLKRKLGAAIAYVLDRGTILSFSEYLKNADDEPLMELYTAAFPIKVGKKAQFVIFGEEGMKLKRADGKILWRIPPARPRQRPRWHAGSGGISGDYGGVRRPGFGDFQGDGKKEIVSLRIWRPPDGKTQTRIDAHSVQGERLWRWELDSYSDRPVYADFDGDGFMEIALDRKTGIAIVDLTPQ
ncbi:hypothetical protein HQ563_04875 [bacterium]|nr:hypothetical protein [bacterium]